MFIRSNGRKSSSFRQLFGYIRSDKDRAPENPIALYHNIPFSPRQIIQAFRDNDVFRERNGRAKVRMFHDYISFHPEDAKHLTPEKIESIMQEYINRRAPNALVYAQAHTATNAVHCHFMISGTDLKSTRILGMKKKDLRNLRRDFENWHRERYPELERSICCDRDGDRIRPRQKTNERAMEQRTKSPSQKSKYAQILSRLFRQSKNRDHFFQKIKATELRLYDRKGIVQGVVSPTGKKYRFTTLGISKDMLLQLDRREKERQITRRKQELSRALKQQRKGPEIER